MAMKLFLLSFFLSVSLTLIAEEPQLDSRLDRDKAKRRLEALNDFRLRYSEREVLKALVLNDQETIEAIRREIGLCDEAVERLLMQWDEAKTPEEKEFVLKEAQGGCNLPTLPE